MDKIPFNPYDFFGYLASGFVLAVGMDAVFGFPKILGREPGVIESIALLIAVYVGGQLVATPAKALLEDGLVEKILKRPSVNLFREQKPRIRGLMFPGFYAPLPSETRKRILNKAKAVGINTTGEDLFLHVRFEPATLENAKLMERLSSFLNLYGFNRNLSFVAMLVGVGLLVAARYLPGQDAATWKYGLSLVVAGILLLYRYLKFFRQYSYELFNTYARAK